MCAELGANPNAAQHILEGLKMTEHRHSERYSLTTALALVVFEQMATPGQEIKIGGTSWVRGDNGGNKVTKKIDTINAALGGKTTMADVTSWLKKWMLESTKEHQEWRRNIPDGVGLVPVRERRENAWRRDRMLQPRVNYLAEDRVEAFERWRADVLRRCDDIDGGRA